jgi:hypothetical protein
MGTLKLNEKHTRTAALTATALYFIACLIFFLPIEIAHKITICTSILTLASLWLCPWQMSLVLQSPFLIYLLYYTAQSRDCCRQVYRCTATGRIRL